MSCCINNNPNRYAGSGGGGSMLKRKYANKFNKVSSNKMFSLNGNTNHSYIGNPNSVNSHDPFSSVSQNKCCNEKKVNVSVKNSKGYLKDDIEDVLSSTGVKRKCLLYRLSQEYITQRDNRSDKISKYSTPFRMWYGRELSK